MHLDPRDGAWGGPQAASAGGSDGFVMKLDAAGALVLSTYVGTTVNDFVQFVEGDSAGNIYVVGRDDNSGAVLPGACGSRGVSVRKLTSAGAPVYFKCAVSGGGLGATAFGVAVDASGRAYVPLVSGSPSGYSPSSNVLRVSSDGASATSFTGYTSVSGTPTISAIAIDGAGNTYLAGIESGPNWSKAKQR